MITAHLPAGYVLARKAKFTGSLMVAALIGAIFPDIDLLWFFFIDDRAFHHHRYWVHAPAFALICSIMLVAITRVSPMAVAFAAGWCLHILLDAPVGGIMWLWPVSDTLFYVWTVPATQAHWILSFVLHWSFALELVIWGTAFTLYVQRRCQ